MLLAVDVGNTQTVIGLFAQSHLSCHWRIATDKVATADELNIKIRGLFSISPYTLDDIDDMVLSSVVPALSDLWHEVASALYLPVLDINATVKSNFSIRYDNPAEIGADRIADAAGAVQIYDAPVIVVDLGTATNIEVIDKDRTFVGGIIAPGLVTSADALFNAAARLSRIDLAAPARAIGSNTHDAVQSGLMYGEVARIDGLVKRIFDELGYQTTVVATGGLASKVAPFSETITDIDENLTLMGLQFLFEMNR